MTSRRGSANLFSKHFGYFLENLSPRDSLSDTFWDIFFKKILHTLFLRSTTTSWRGFSKIENYWISLSNNFSAFLTSKCFLLSCGKLDDWICRRCYLFLEGKFSSQFALIRETQRRQYNSRNRQLFFISFSLPWNLLVLPRLDVDKTSNAALQAR